MSKFLKVLDGNYNIKVQDGGEIILDTGSAVGTVYITGDLEVQGTTTTIDTANLTIEDNTILLNKGWVGNGIGFEKNFQAGIEIERGEAPNVQILFSETQTWQEPLSNYSSTPRSGGFSFTRTTDGAEIGIRTNSIKSLTSPGVINLEPTSSGTVRIEGANYHTALLAENAAYPLLLDRFPGGANATPLSSTVPNKRYVDQAIFDAVSSLAPTSIASANTSVDTEDTGVGDSTSRVTITVDGALTNEFYLDYVKFHQMNIDLAELRIDQSTIMANITGGDLILQAQGTNSVRIDDTLMIKATGANPAYDGIGLKLYANTQGTGKTGLFYVNTSNIRDEIVSKNRSLLFSMLF
jgi:hypothetical protein